MVYYTVKSLREYLEEVEGRSRGEILLFRGQPVEGNLLPNVARLPQLGDSTELEKKAIEQMRLYGASLLDASLNSSTLDYMVIAQHHGMRTRLLDWTSNPLAALWFACNRSLNSAKTVYVYMLVADELIERGAYQASFDPFSVQKTRVVQPRLNNPRVMAQDGWFTLHRYSNEFKRFVALENNREVQGKLTGFAIDISYAPFILRSLDRVGVNDRTLFPDLDGLCHFINKNHFY